MNESIFFKSIVLVVCSFSLIGCGEGNPGTEASSSTNSSHSTNSPSTFGGTGNGGNTATVFPAPVVATPAAPVAAVTVQPSLTFVTAAANQWIHGWEPEMILDQDSGTCFSTPIQIGYYYAGTNGWRLNAWIDGSHGPATATAIQLQARMYNGVPLGFPPTYKLYVTSNDNHSWVDLGNFSNQPDANGVVQIGIGSRQTYGIMIIPLSLGLDNYGNPYFQLCGARLQ